MYFLLSLCLSLNSFYTETQRSWVSVSPDIRWVILIKRSWVRVPNWVLAGFQSWPQGFKSQTRFGLGLSLGIWVQGPIWGKWFQIGTTKPKIRRQQDVLLAASKEDTRDLSQSSVFPNSKSGAVLFCSNLFVWKSLSRVQLFATPRTIRSMEFSRPEHWSG